MDGKSEIVQMFMRDLWAFLKFQKMSEGKFGNEFRMNKVLYSNLVADKHTPTIETIEKCYTIMAEKDFPTMRDAVDRLILTALHYEEGEHQDLIAAAIALQTRNQEYPDVPSS